MVTLRGFRLGLLSLLSGNSSLVRLDLDSPGLLAVYVAVLFAIAGFVGGGSVVERLWGEKRLDKLRSFWGANEKMGW